MDTDRLLFLDTETTGLSPDRGDRVVEIGVVEAVGRVLTGRHYHTYLNPERACDSRAFEVHGLTDEFLAQQSKFEQVMADFLGFIGTATLVIHNASFDMGFINNELKLCQQPPLKNAVKDSLSLSRALNQGLSNYKLDTLCDHYGVNRSGRTLHGALMDAELLAEVYLRMTRTQEGLDLNPFENLKYLQKLGGRKPHLKAYAVSEEAKANHQAMIEAISKKHPHLWG